MTDADRRGRRCERPPAPRLTTAMVAVAWSVAHCADPDDEDAQVLAALVLQAAQAAPASPRRLIERPARRRAS